MNIQRLARKAGTVLLYVVIVVFGGRLWSESAAVGYWPCLGSALIGTILSGMVNYRRGKAGVDGLPMRFTPLAWAAGVLLMSVIWELVK